MNKPLPPDQAARDRATEELDTNLLVEAGAGSGKTTLMAKRIVALIEAGRPADQIAAVTFTRKAASELRERVQLALETANQAPERANEIFIGTIHSFCARLLRERPVEAGLDPRFRELDELESGALARDFWDSWIERLFVTDSPLLTSLREVGVQPTRLDDAFRTFVTYPDVDFSAPECPAPAIRELVTTLKTFIAEGVALMPSEPPAAGWDDVQSQLWQLHFEQRSRDWSRPAEFFASLTLLTESAKLTQIRWVREASKAAEQKAEAKKFVEQLQAWRSGPAAHALTQWHEHCYAPVTALAQQAAVAFAQYRMATGRLSFEDLLLHAAALLREDPVARGALGERWRYVLVDEFQDTDPVQAEVLFLLGSAPDSGSDWAAVKLRDGALFVVGDPKQSIYRFRRADIETYQTARRTLETQGAVLQLTANFRSLPSITTFVNGHFGERGAFPEAATSEQAAYAPLQPVREGDGEVGVERYEVSARQGAAGKDIIIALDAQQIASWVADAIGKKDAKAGDVMILTRTKEALAEIARQLSARGIPVAVTGAAVTLEAELQELRVLLQLMRDPNNPVLVVAALEGRFFGCSPADLWAAQNASIGFTVVTPPSATPANKRAARVHEALTCLHGWLLQSRQDAPDVFLSRILAETGLLAWAAADELGDVRAGLLLRLVEEVRKASLDPETAGDAAYDALESLLSNELPDAPLLPGRTDAVRVMNLHKAKGLESKIVILAAPLAANEFPPRVAVRREAGRAVGAVQISEKVGQQYRVIAQPVDWAERQEDETRFQKAEGERLRYVAATRACDRLLIAEFVLVKRDGPERKNDREWSAFSPTLDALKIAASPMPIVDAQGRPELKDTPEMVMQRATDAEVRRANAAVPGWAWKTVTASAKSEYQARAALEDVSATGRGAGAAWGRAVHRTLEEAGRLGLGTLPKATAARIAAEEHIPEREDALHEVVTRVLQGSQWQALTSAPARRFEWPVTGWVTRDGVSTYLEGVMDAAYQTADDWHLIDWKTDDVIDEEWVRREEVYNRQLAIYAELLATATGASVTHEIVRVR